MADIQVIDHLGKLEENAVRVRRGIENGAQKMSSAAPDVGDGA
jgi:hypothetical protein